MTLLYTSATFEEHITGANHPERPQRIAALLEMLAASGLGDRLTARNWQPATLETIQLCHEPSYLATLESFVMHGGGRIEVDTVCSGASWDVATLAAGAACDAVDQVLSGNDPTALCLIRPPGHHALRAEAMGFCLINNVAVAARHAIVRHKLDRVLIVDWDVHHGNGTQDIFYEDEQVGFLSSHRWPFYPGTGAADETGRGRGLGTTFNCPFEYGTPREEQLGTFEAALHDIARRMQPQLVLISAGFDAHRLDPIGSLDLETEDFATLTRMVVDCARAYCDGRIVSLLEGGYNVDALAASVAQHANVLLDSAPDARSKTS